MERPQNEDSRHTRTLTQRTDSAKRRQRQTEPKKEHFPPPTYFFFPDSLTKLRVWSGPACCLVASSPVAMPALRPLRCHRVAQTRFGPRVGNSLGQTFRGSEKAANPLPLQFLFLSLFPFLTSGSFSSSPRARERVDGPGGGRGRAKGDGKEAGESELIISHELRLLHSFLVR